MAISPPVRIAASTIAVLVLAAGAARAESITRLRIESTYLRAVVADVRERSPTLRRLMTQVDESNVIAYLICERFAGGTLRGRTFLTSGNHDARYVRVHVDCMLPRIDLVAIVGHELQHVAEIAVTDAVVDGRSFGALYKIIGFPTGGFRLWEQFETMAAVRAGERVRQEYAGRTIAH